MVYTDSLHGTRVRSSHVQLQSSTNTPVTLAGQEQELVKLVNHIEEASTAYGMQISAEKTQLVINNTNGISTDITIVRN